jgi:hypothetical protein
MNIRDKLRESICRAIKQCPMKRQKIAAEMSSLVGNEVTKFMIDSWTAKSKPQNRIPAEYIPVFCRVTETKEPIKIIASASGVLVLPNPFKISNFKLVIRFLKGMVCLARAEKKKRELFLKEMEGRSDV